MTVSLEASQFSQLTGLYSLAFVNMPEIEMDHPMAHSSITDSELLFAQTIDA